MLEQDVKPPRRASGYVSRRLSTLVPEGVSSLLNSRRTTRTDHHQSPSSWYESQDDNSMHTEYMTIKQKIMESSRDPPLKSHRRSTSRISYLRNSSSRNSSSSEDSSRSSSSGDVPYVDRPFKDGRRRKICHACYQPFGEHERVDICDGCCFERPAGCRECNWTGWAKCSTCVGHDHTVGASPFETGFTRAPLVGSDGQRHRLRSWGLRQISSGANAS